MEKIYYFIELTRIKRPIGYMLLFWPCVWGLTIAYDFSNNIQIFLKYGVLFLCGSILMRSAGCIINDIVDKDFDAKVSRTKTRPIASGKISVRLGLFYSAFLCLIAFLVLIQFNTFTIILAMCSMPLAFSYPYMKRFTYWPQLFLGITFNYGLILGWTAISENLTIIPCVFYFGAIFWTLGYDTIYGYQDINDDEIIGVKSTSIKFKNNPKKFISFSYLVFISTLFIVGFLMDYNIFFYLSLIIPILHLFYFQVFSLDVNDEKNCLSKFKSNNLLGLIILTNIIIGKVF